MVILGTLYLLLTFSYCYVNSLEPKGSLTFVIDDTYSMYDDIDQVKIKTNEVFDAVLYSNSSTIDDFLLITFNDPGNPVLRVRTRDRNKFKTALRNINVHGGGDCPELAMGGIELALEESKPKSFLYVSTDAAARDHDKIETVMRLSQKKSTQVTFLLTGDCNDPHNKNYIVYDKLAVATSGQVFHIEKHDINKVIDFIIASIAHKKTSLLQRTLDSGSKKKLFFTVDSKIWDVIVSVTGENPSFTVTDSNGNGIDTDIITETTKSNVRKLKLNKSGIYYINLHSDKETSVMVTGSTSLYFQHGFSPFEPSSLNETSTMPLPDGNTYLSIVLDNVESDTVLDSAVLKDLNGDIIKGPLKLNLIDEDKKFYATEPFEPPNEMFVVAVNGYVSKTLENITRISPTAVAKRIPKPPSDKKIITKSPVIRVLPGDTIEALYGQPLVIKCKLHAYPKPDVLWENESDIYMPSTVLLDYPYDYVSIYKMDKVEKNSTVTCKALNSEGEDAKSVKIVLKNYLNILEYPTDVTVEYGKKSELKFIIDAYPFATIVWYKNHKQLTSNDNFEISPDNTTLYIKRMVPELKGNYSVEANNGIVEKKIYFKVMISGMEKPKIDKTNKYFMAEEGQKIEIYCRLLQGTPKPVVSWLYTSNDSDEPIKYGTSETFYINSVKISDKGTYKCSVQNDFGEDSHEIELYVKYAPSVNIDNVNGNIKEEGALVILICYVDGFPFPNIRWLKNGTEIISKSKYRTNNDNVLRFKASLKDSGIYTCEASNYLGKAKKDTQLNVYDPVTILPPKERVFNLEVGSLLTLACVADGYPKPDVKWTFQNFDTNILPKTLRADEVNSIRIEHLQLQDEGYYICEARNYVNESRIIYEVYVEVKPWIENELVQNNINIVEGDVAARIPCKADGKPKPTISWTVNGLNIAIGTKWYDVAEDGTLVIKNVRKSDEGTYSCKAVNVVGSVTKDFDVFVHPYPEEFSEPIKVSLEEGSSATIECDLHHDAIDSVRWFKNRKVISNHKVLYLGNVSISDAGLYSCRVSSFKSSHTSHKIVMVGHKPKFLTDEETEIEFFDGATVFLECNATGEPKPMITWFHNGRRIEETSFNHFIEMNSGNTGSYTCEVQNIYGTIRRNFEISDKSCLLHVESDFDTHQPLMLSLSRRWLEFEISDGFVRIPKEQELLLICPENHIYYNTLMLGEQEIATCIGKSTFKIKKRLYDFKKLKCRKEIKSLAKGTGVACSEGNSELFTVGFTLRSEFLGVYDVCFDKDNIIPIYTKHDIHRSHAGFVPKEKVEYRRSKYLPFNFDEMYSCGVDECCYAKRQLVSPRDVSPGMSQVSTYNYLNILPQWSTCGTENWDEIERRVRSLVKVFDYKLLIWTGSYYQTYHIDERSSTLGTVQQPNPLLMWKVIQDFQEQGALAIIQVNIPDLSPSEAASYIPCKDICDDIEWMRNPDWLDVKKGLTFCCSVEDFKKAFGYGSLFRGPTDVLKYDYRISKHTLA